MKSTMLKYKQIVKKTISLISLSLFMSASIYSVQEYSSIIGLFNNFNIQISGNDYIDALLIESEIYPQISSSLLTVNLTDIQNKLESMEYIEAVQVSRILPHTLIIHIVERSPMLLVNTTDKIIFMDTKGVLLPADKHSIGTFPVPVLSILEDNGSIEKYTGDITQLFQFLLAEYPNFYKNLSEVKIQKSVWEFYSDNNTKIYAHASDLINQLNILKDFEKTVYPIRDIKDYRYIDLRIKDQVIVKEKYLKS
tara:strand:+ start:1828 stop:2583 length:756 start_codon:yes stop_codon:yes gene_type:complete